MSAPDLKAKVRALPDKPGVYLMKDRLGQIIYVGKAKSLRRRVASYFTRSRASVAQPKIRALIDLIYDFDIIEVRSEPEALLLEGRLIKEWKPKYNTDFVDDKRFLLVRVDLASELPRFSLTRMKKADTARYFGPFPHSSLLRRTLAQMQRKFGVLLGDARPQQLEGGRWQLFDDVRADLSGHPNIVSAQEYRARVEAGVEFLEGKSQEWLESLREEMRRAAAAQEYEQAAALRDAVQALEETLRKTRRFERAPDVLRTDSVALSSLHEVLHLAGPPARIECFDISHISGTFVVASMVHFRDGRPEKDEYRRFRIRSFIGNDDFRAMEEVVGRRYQRLSEEGKPMPDLIVIDGGAGQVGAALQAFLALEIVPPALIGLAKKHETIIFGDSREPLNLPLNHPGLNLLQRVRDEAHRFANTYNADLRSQRIRESVLDECPGLGPKRRAALLEHFGSIERIRGAAQDEIAEVPGVGPSLAAEVHAFLHPAEKDK
jgi:excinuclease ABC subunit C